MNGSLTSTYTTAMPKAEITGLPEGMYGAYVVAVANVSSTTAPGLQSLTVLFTVNPCKELVITCSQGRLLEFRALLNY